MSGGGPKDRGVKTFVWADEEVLARVAAERSYVLMACYLGLCRLANASTPRTRDGFEVGIPSLTAAMGAKDKKTARAALWKLDALGLISIKQRKTARDENLPHLVWLFEGGSPSDGSTQLGRTAGTDVGRQTDDRRPSGDRGSSISREQGGPSAGRRSVEEEEEKTTPEEHPPGSPPSRIAPAARPAVPSTLDLSKLQTNGNCPGEGDGDFLVGGEVQRQRGPKLDDALKRYGRKTLNLGSRANYVPDAVADIRSRPSRLNDPVLPVDELLAIVSALAESEKRRRERAR